MNQQRGDLASGQDVALTKVLVGLVDASTIGGVWLTQGSERKRAAEALEAQVAEAHRFETIPAGTTLGSSRCERFSHP
jgi:hypothetical protein